MRNERASVFVVGDYDTMTLCLYCVQVCLFVRVCVYLCVGASVAVC